MIVFAVILGFIMMLGVFTLAYQIFRLVIMDAESRGLKHPKLWGLLSLSGNNGSGGLILYLIGRNRYPSNMSKEQKDILSSRKKRAGISLCFIAVGTIGLIGMAVFGNIM